MAGRLPVKSGHDVLRTFYRVRDRFNIAFKRRGRGSHVVLHSRSCKNFSVPMHDELDTGTLLGIIEDAGMTKDEFIANDP